MKTLLTLTLLATSLNAYAYCPFPNNPYDEPNQKELAISQYNRCVEREQQEAENARENARLVEEMNRCAEERAESMRRSQEQSYNLLN